MATTKKKLGLTDRHIKINVNNNSLFLLLLSIINIEFCTLR